jgi:glycosyltransferase involved in cell wall biosynthesis
MTFAIVTNIPSPYRVVLFNLLAERFGNSFWVIYCAKNEPNRSWEVPDLQHNHIFLESKKINNSLYYYSDIIRHLKSLKPNILIIAGFNPVFLRARIYAIINKIKTIEYTDSWLSSIKHLSLLHKIIRRIFLNFVDACLCISQKGQEYLMKYGVAKQRIFISPLAIENNRFSSLINNTKEYHVMYSGQFILRKMPFFFIDVCLALNKIIKNFRVLLIGDGPLKLEILSKLNEYKINFEYPGFIQQTELPNFYSKSKILLFPTKLDPWGLIANEACASGVPVITCKNAGVSDELIINEVTGYVLPLHINSWVEKSVELLTDDKKYAQFSKNCLEHIKKYTVNESVKGFVKAIDYINAKG